VFKTVTVQNANLDISLPTKTVHKYVHNAIMLTVQNVKITLGIVKHVFLDTLYISLNKFVKFQQFQTVSQSSMEGVKLVMMVTK